MAEGKTYDNTNRGALFRNDRRTNEKQPTHKGEINIEGVEYWLSGWVAESRSGTKYFQLAVTKKDAAPARPAVEDSADDDVPF